MFKLTYLQQYSCMKHLFSIKNVNLKKKSAINSRSNPNFTAKIRWFWSWYGIVFRNVISIYIPWIQQIIKNKYKILTNLCRRMHLRDKPFISFVQQYNAWWPEINNESFFSLSISTHEINNNEIYLLWFIRTHYNVEYKYNVDIELIPFTIYLIICLLIQIHNLRKLLPIILINDSSGSNHSPKYTILIVVAFTK